MQWAEGTEHGQEVFKEEGEGWKYNKENWVKVFLLPLWSLKRYITSFWSQLCFLWNKLHQQRCHQQAAGKSTLFYCVLVNKKCLIGVVLTVSSSSNSWEASFPSPVVGSVMWDSTGSGKCPFDWSAEITLWHPFSGALPVLWRLLPAPHPHRTLPGWWELGATQDHLHKVWVQHNASYEIIRFQVPSWV